MKALDNAAADIFSKMLKKLGDRSFVCLKSMDWPPLFIECYGILKSGFGVGCVYSLVQTITKGDETLVEPQMFFLVFTDDGSNIFKGVCPYSYQMESAGVYEQSMLFLPNAHLELNLNLQEKHVRLANDWLVQIKGQGFVL